MRRVVATACFATIVTFFVTSSASLMISLGWIARVQFVPAFLTGSFGVVILTLLATLIFGRIYCSTLCPMGYIQDIAGRARRLTRKQRLRRRYVYSAPRNRVRLTMLLCIAAATIAGSSLLLAIFDPYGGFGRIATWLIRPLVASGTVPEAVGAALCATVLAGVTLVGIALWSAREGRMFCNTLCPVGSTLGLVSRYSVMHFDINTDRCVNCRKCVNSCKARCIDMQDHVVDMSRCVVCFDCLDSCDNTAITYTHRRHRLSIPLMMRVGRPASASAASNPAPTAPASTSTSTTQATAADESTSAAKKTGRGVSRRTFIAAALVAASAPALKAAKRAEQTVGGDERRSLPHRPVPPPGSRSIERLLQRCVACGACVDVCPQNVIRPAMGEYGVLHPLVPLMDYEASFCKFDCNDCTRVCPTGALTPLTLIEKQNTAIGLATVDADLCVGCGKCARSCPKETIKMIKPEGRKRRLAMVDHSSCIGCGVCQNICPVIPSAITVNGLRR